MREISVEFDRVWQNYVVLRDISSIDSAVGVGRRRPDETLSLSVRSRPSSAREIPDRPAVRRRQSNFGNDPSLFSFFQVARPVTSRSRSRAERRRIEPRGTGTLIGAARFPFRSGIPVSSEITFKARESASATPRTSRTQNTNDDTPYRFIVRSCLYVYFFIFFTSRSEESSRIMFSRQF